MIRFAVGAMMAGIALMPFVGSLGSQTSVDQAPNSAHSEIIYRVRGFGDDTCRFMLVGNPHQVELPASPQADCAALDERLDAARIWHTQADGTVVLTSSAGAELMRLVVGLASA